ncbi:MAG: helix-turn-helix domain-containing protein [bacterium]
MSEPEHGESCRPNIAALPKLIMVHRGVMRYFFEGRAVDLRRGTILYRPPHHMTHWEVRSRQRALIHSCTFEVEPSEPALHQPMLAQASRGQLERAAFQRLAELDPASDDHSELIAEAELKALLGRSLVRARPVAFDVSQAHPEERTSGRIGVERALAWLEENFARSDALVGLHQRAGLSPNHFRLLFRQVTGQSPSQYLKTLRMKASRFYLNRSNQSVKQVAAAVGYDNPLYFSRLFREFWGYPPSRVNKFNP